MKYVKYVGRHGNRSSWDPMTLLYAVHGNAGGLYTQVSTGFSAVRATGQNEWIDDGAHHKQSYLVLPSAHIAEMERQLDALLLVPPTPTSASAGGALQGIRLLRGRQQQRFGYARRAWNCACLLGGACSIAIARCMASGCCSDSSSSASATPVAHRIAPVY